MRSLIADSPVLESRPQSKRASFRIQSIDLLRGIIMVVMAIDHVRVYSGMPAGGPTAGIFFTRWITHYCAPGFAFFAGTSAFLYLTKTKSTKDLATFLITRGLLLMILELTVIRYFWMFNFNYDEFGFTGVIWMLGGCMVLFAAFVKLKPLTLAILGLAIIAFQQVFYFVPAIFPESFQQSVAYVWQVFYPVASPGNQSNILSGSSGLPKFLGLNVFYVLIPWIGVMMTGYAFGQILLREPKERNKMCLRIGLAATILFLVAGSAFALYDSENDTPFVFKLLGQQKYPPSQLFLLMTIGPLIALVPWAEKATGWVANAAITIGRVPLFYYLVHILLIHLSAFVVNLLIFGTIHQDWYTTAPFVGVPEDQRWGLPLLYLVWVIDVVILYFICNSYAKYKLGHPEKAWLKYL
jgi:uncharacterized membrane protein